MKPRYQSLILCLVLTLLCSLPPVLLVMWGGIHSIASYKDFVVSDLVFSGYNKRLELRAILLFLFCDFLLLPLLLWQRERILRLCRPGFNRLRLLGQYIGQKLQGAIHSPLFDPRSGTFALVLLGGLYLLYLAGNIHSPAQKMAVYPVIFTYLALVYVLRERPELFSHVCMAGIGCYFSFIGILVALHPGSEFFNEARLYIIPLCCACTIALCFLLCRYTSWQKRKIVAIFWAFVPCLLFALARYTYIYEGKPVEIYTSWFPGSFFNILIIILLCANIVAIKFNKNSFVFILSAMCLATYLAWRMPHPVIPVDYFHGGEMSTPFQQWKEFGKVPFIDYHPVHGLCDYYYAALSYLFFDSSYSAVNTGWAIGTSLQAALLILVLGLVYPNSYAVLLLAIFLPNLGMRLLAVGLCLPLSLWAFQRWNAIWFFLWSVFSCLVCFLWNVPPGAAYCGALLPLLAAKFWSYRKMPFRPSRWQVSAGVLLCLLLLALWPMVKALIINTLLTAKISAEVHGLSVPAGLMSAPWLMTLKALLFLPFLAFLYFRAFSSRARSAAPLLLPLSLTIFSLVYANYAFLRYHRGGRALDLGLLLIIASIPALRFTRPLCRFFGYAFLGLVLLLSTRDPLPLSYPRIYQQQVYGCPPGLILSTDAAGNSLENLGRGLIKRSDLETLQKLQPYLTKNGPLIANLDSSLALYSIYNIASPLKFMTGFNSSGMDMQKDTINRIKDNGIQSILLPANWNGLRRPLYYMLTQLYIMGFSPDAIINGYLFLKKEPGEAGGGALRPEKIRLPVLIRKLAHLPQVWAPACPTWTEPVELPYTLSLENCEQAKQGGFRSPKGGDITVTLHFTEPVSAKELAFIMLSTDIGRGNRLAAVTSPEIADGKDGYIFWLGKRPGALPLFLNYRWLFAPELKEIVLKIPDVPAGKAFALDIGFRRFREE